VILAQTASLNHVKMLHSGGGVAASVKQPEPATFPRGGKAAQPAILHKTNQEQTGPPPPPTFALQIPKPVSMPGPVSSNTRVQFMSSSESVSSSIDPYVSSGSSVPNWHRGCWYLSETSPATPRSFVRTDCAKRAGSCKTNGFFSQFSHQHLFSTSACFQYWS